MVEPTHLKKQYSSNWIISQGFGVNIKSLKPPPCASLPQPHPQPAARHWDPNSSWQCTRHVVPARQVRHQIMRFSRFFFAPRKTWKWVVAPIWGFPEMVVPNNYWFSYEKLSFWGVKWGYHHLRKYPYVLRFENLK